MIEISRMRVEHCFKERREGERMITYNEILIC
jgi:hypothetical protein